MEKQNNSLVITADSKNVEIIYVGNSVSIKFKDDIDIAIEMGGNVFIGSKGDFHIGADGELGLFSNGKPLCLDSIDSEIHMNYRQSKPIKNLPESIAYRKKLDDQNVQIEEHYKSPEFELNELKEKLAELDKQFWILEQRVTYIAKDYKSKGY